MGTYNIRTYSFCIKSISDILIIIFVFYLLVVIGVQTYLLVALSVTLLLG